MRGVAVLGMALVVLYIAVDVVLQSLPPHYSVISDAESNLAVGEFGIAPTTTTGAVHVAFATTGFLCALAGMLLLAVWMRDAGRLARVRRAATGFVALAAVGLVLLAVSIAWAPSVLGLTERVCLAGILGWAFVVCWGARRSFRR